MSTTFTQYGKRAYATRSVLVRTAFSIFTSIVFSFQTALAQQVQKEITFDWVTELANRRAAEAFTEAQSELPEILKKLDYDGYRQIQFRHEKALWVSEELPFRLELFHRGYLYKDRVKLNEFNTTHAQPIRFSQDFFEYGQFSSPNKIPYDVGYAGFRLLYPVNDSGRWDEVASFLGASYFRMLGKGQRYGTSARALAINTGELDRSEEFPIFTEWWLGKPEKETRNLRFYGLLESTNCTAAYEFLFRPGGTTIADVSVVLFLREPKSDQPGQSIKTLGLAPLTSMFWFGENSQQKPNDYRPEVHDADGLLTRDAQNRFSWRPLDNPPVLRHQIFSQPNPRGFGLLQRDREFANYQDLFNPYHQTPTVWIEPRGQWGEGDLHLVELPTRYEGDDNVVVFWEPKAKPQPRQPFRFGYTMHWTLQPEMGTNISRVIQTRVGAATGDPAKRQYVIDFTSFTESGEPSGTVPEAEVRSAKNEVISDVQVFKNEPMTAWRVIFSVKTGESHKEQLELSCVLKKGGSPVSETWQYLWTPASTNIAKN